MTGRVVHGHKKTKGYKEMRVRKIREERITKPAALMGKGRHILLVSKGIKAVRKLPFALPQKQVGAAQAATNYLQ